VSDPRISPELAVFLESGLSIHVATRDRQLWPESCVAVALRVHADRKHVDLFLPLPRSQSVLDNLADNNLVAFSGSEATTHRTVQLKGRSIAIEPESPADRSFIDAHLDRAVTMFDLVGVPYAVTGRIVHTPAMRVTVDVAEIYQQTPGPDAGTPLVGTLR
jgi:hypothetical protein